MLSSVERLLAWRYLRARRREGFVSVITAFSLLGILLGVGTLVVVLSVFNGVRQETLERLLGVSGAIAVYPGGTARIFDEPEELVARLLAVEGVSGAIPVIAGEVLISGPRGSSGGQIKGIRPVDLLDRSAIIGSGRLVAGDLNNFKGLEAILIGRRLAERLAVSVGDRITVISPNGVRTVIGTVPRMKGFNIVGIFEIGYYSFDNMLLYTPLRAAQQFFRLGDSVTKIELDLRDPDQICGTRRNHPDCTQAILRNAAEEDGLMEVGIGDWKQINSNFFATVEAQRTVVFLILALIVLVAAFNIICGMIMLVKEKRREIAILRTMGAGRTLILRIFFTSGAVVGIFGTGLGLGLGVLVSAHLETIRQFLEYVLKVPLFPPDVYNLSGLPTLVQQEDLFAVGMMGIVLSFVATLYPAWRAAWLDPVEVLRDE